MLPPAAAAALEELFASTAPPQERSPLSSRALAAVGYPPKGELVPLPEDLTTAQRAVAELIADDAHIGLAKWAMPFPAWCRLRWLGRTPPGAIERAIAFVDGARSEVPLWRALAIVTARGGQEAVRTFFRELTLSPVDRLDVFVDYTLSAYELGQFSLKLDVEPVIDADRNGAGVWAARTADRLTDGWPPDAKGRRSVPRPVAVLVLLALVRGGATIEPRWDVLVDPSEVRDERWLEILRAIPEPRRAAAIVPSLETRFTNWAVRSALWLVDEFPSEPLVKVVLDRASDCDFPKREILATLEASAKRHSLVRTLLDAYRGKQPKPLKLRCTELLRPRALEELSDAQRVQLAEVFEGFDDKDVSLEARFGPHGDGDSLETIGTAIRRIVGPAGSPAYDAISYGADDGRVFEAGTTNTVAILVQHLVECEDPRLKEALQSALAEKPRAPKRRTTTATKTRASKKRSS